MFTKSLTIALTLIGFGVSPVLAEAPAKQPNIIFIMADDLGNADIGYHGGRPKTPNIDKLAHEGVRSNPSTASRCARPRARR